MAMTPMQQLVRARLAHLGISQREAGDRSHGLLSHATLSRIMNGVSAGPWSVKTLRGLSLALDMPLSEVETVALVPSAGAAFELPREASRLTAEERRAVLQVVRVLLERHGVSGMK